LTIFLSLLKISHSSPIKAKILRFAIIKNLEIVGEASYLLTKNFRQANTTVEWDEIIGMRHILVHGYYQIKDEIIWETIVSELLPLKQKISALLEDLF